MTQPNRSLSARVDFAVDDETLAALLEIGEAAKRLADLIAAFEATVNFKATRQNPSCL